MLIIYLLIYKNMEVYSQFNDIPIKKGILNIRKKYLLKKESLKDNIYKNYIPNSATNIFKKYNKLGIDINNLNNKKIINESKKDIHKANLIFSNYKSNFSNNSYLPSKMLLTNLNNVNNNNQKKLNDFIKINSSEKTSNNKIEVSNLSQDKYLFHKKNLNNNIQSLRKEKKRLVISESFNLNKNNNNYINYNKTNKNKNKKNKYDEEEHSELSEIAEKIVNSFIRKRNNNINITGNLIQKQNKNFLLKKMINKNMIGHNKNKKSNPNNYTFKTIFVNNFCVLPNNPYFIDGNNSYNNRRITTSKYINTDNNNRPENIVNNESNFNNNNYKYSLLINSKKNINLQNNSNNLCDGENKKKRIKKFNRNLFLKDIDIGKEKINIDNSKISNIHDNNNNEFKEKNFNEEYYYNVTDFSNFQNLKEKSKKEIEGVKKNKIKYKHIKFDLSKNVLFIYKENDYISKYKKYSNNHISNTKNTKNLKINNKPIIRQFNANDFKINKNYLFKEYLDEDEIVSESTKFNIKYFI